ncbi:MAG: hypothetical protein HY903_11905 [Deltaproteobacteria bacterium]|nr:hypothetical protein [Deltaproteobacteria bacterium]
MKRFGALLAISWLMGACGSIGEIGSDDWMKGFDDAQKVVAGLGGNGAPSGAHFNLNMIGVPKDKSADMTGSQGHRMFLPLWGSAKIMLKEGPFQVLDANGTDGTAQFQLPSPDPENDGITEYSVFARALGTPGGSATMTTCLEDATTLEEYCSIYQTVQVRSTGGSKFTNVSRELLYVYADINADGTIERVPLFADALGPDVQEIYYWQYDNSGLKLMQLRFYEVPTNVN